MTKSTKVTIAINKETYKLNKGISFFKALDILPKNTGENVDKIGDIVFGLKAEDPFVVADILKAGLTEADELSDEMIDEFVFNDADVEKEAAKLIDFLKQTAFSGMVNKILTQVEANLEKAQAEMEKPLN